MVTYELVARSGSARAGLLHTPHGTIQTPSFFPVATQATVKGLTVRDLRGAGVTGVLANAYHLWLRPGHEEVQRLGGLHRLMGWDGPIVTDSGGFQVFSLAHLVEVDDQGVTFESHIDQEKRRLTPELAVEIQAALGADVAMTLDVCTPYSCPPDVLRDSVGHTVRWAERAAALNRPEQTGLFGIVQGGVDLALREGCAREIAELPFDGFGIGGLSVGEPRSETWPALEASLEPLPTDRARYLMGVGAPDDLIEGIARGIDLFDCVLPTRLGRHGTVLTPGGKLSLRASRLVDQAGPLDAECDCPACTTFPVAFLHHLTRLRDPFGMRLASVHNLRFLTRLVEAARNAILEGTFTGFRGAWRRSPGRGELVG